MKYRILEPEDAPLGISSVSFLFYDYGSKSREEEARSSFSFYLLPGNNGKIKKKQEAGPHHHQNPRDFTSHLASFVKVNETPVITK